MAIKKITEFAPLILAGLGLMASSFFLLDERRLLQIGPTNSPKQKAIATVFIEGKDARRRPQSNFFWMPLRHHDDIYQYDTIYTGKDTRAIVTFKDDREVKVPPESLIFIDHKIESKKRANLNNELAASGLFARGDSLKSNKDLDLGEWGKIHLESMPVDLVSPKLNAKLWNSQSEDIVFAWKELGQEKREEYNLLIYTMGKDKVKKIIDQRLSGDEKEQVPFELLPIDQNIFWEIQHAGKTISPIGSFKLKTNPPPVALFPNENQWQRNFSTGLTFKWNSPTVAYQFHFQLAFDQEFKKIFKDEIVGANRRNEFSTHLESGTYYWRVRSKASFRPDSDWSRPRKIHVGLELRPRILVAPEMNASIDSQYQSTEINFKWSEPKENIIVDPKQMPLRPNSILAMDRPDYFLIEIAKNKDFAEDSIVQRLKTKDYKIDIKLETGREYFWRVTAVKFQGEKTLSSPAQKFKLNFIPFLAPPSSLAVELKWQEGIYDYDLKWKPVADAKEYFIEIIDSEQQTYFSDIVKVEELKLRLMEQKKLKWKVAAIDQWGRKGAFSPAQALPKFIEERALPERSVASKDLVVKKINQPKKDLGPVKKAPSPLRRIESRPLAEDIFWAVLE